MVRGFRSHNLLSASISLWLLLCLNPASADGADAELLEPDKAFRLTVRVLDPTRLELSYAIAPGYYLYRDRFRFDVEPNGVSVGMAQIPPGEIEDDPTFGKVAIFRDTLRITLPITRAKRAAQDITLTVTSQGCADAGVCYVPQKKKMFVHLPGAP